MRYLLILSLIVSTLFSNEIQRIEAIVDDIAKLRLKYEECRVDLQNANINTKKSVQKELKTCTNEKKQVESLRYMLNEQKEKNAILLANIASVETNNTNKLEEKILALNKELLHYKNLLEKKEIEIKNLKNRLANKECKTKVITKTKVVFKDAPETNVFPKLVPINASKKIDSEVIQEVKASTFRLKSDANIYDSIDGNIINKWEKNRSFTSNIQTKSWIKITGYFIDKKWHSVDKNLWVLKAKCKKR